jgi:hypothetical protein
MYCIDKGNTRANTRAPITAQVSLAGRVTILHSLDSPAQREREPFPAGTRIIPSENENHSQRERESFLLRMIRNSNNNENHSYCKRFAIATIMRIILIANDSQ